MHVCVRVKYRQPGRKPSYQHSNMDLLRLQKLEKKRPTSLHASWPRLHATLLSSAFSSNASKAPGSPTKKLKPRNTEAPNLKV